DGVGDDGQPLVRRDREIDRRAADRVHQREADQGLRRFAIRDVHDRDRVLAGRDEGPVPVGVEHHLFVVADDHQVGERRTRPRGQRQRQGEEQTQERDGTVIGRRHGWLLPARFSGRADGGTNGAGSPDHRSAPPTAVLRPHGYRPYTSSNIRSTRSNDRGPPGQTGGAGGQSCDGRWGGAVTTSTISAGCRAAEVRSSGVASAPSFWFSWRSILASTRA